MTKSNSESSQTFFESNKSAVDIGTDNKTEIIFCKLWVDKINTKGKKDRRLLIISEGFISLYKSRPFIKEPALSRQFSWFSLLKIQETTSGTEHEENIIELMFDGGTMTLEHPNSHAICILICKYALTILTSSERPQINVHGFNVDSFLSKIENGSDDSSDGNNEDENENKQKDLSLLHQNPALKRFRSLMFAHKIPIPQQALSCFVHYETDTEFQFSCKDIDFIQFFEFQEHMLNALLLDDSIETLILPNSDPSQLQYHSLTPDVNSKRKKRRFILKDQDSDTSETGGISEKSLTTGPHVHCDWMPLANFLEQNQSVKHLSIGHTFNNTTPDFVSALERFGLCSLESFTLEFNNVKDDMIITLANMLNNMPNLRNVCFRHTMTRRVFKLFLKSAVTCPFITRIRSIQVDKISNLTVLTMMSVCQSIPHITCTNCESEIAGYFNSMAKCEHCNVETLDISGNDGCME